MSYHQNNFRYQLLNLPYGKSRISKKKSRCSLQIQIKVFPELLFPSVWTLPGEKAYTWRAPQTPSPNGWLVDVSEEIWFILGYIEKPASN